MIQRFENANNCLLYILNNKSVYRYLKNMYKIKPLELKKKIIKFKL